MLDLVFVILHYNTFSTTCDCINSIKKNIDTLKYKIIVVDNFSPNNSYIKLCDKYKDNKKITIIQTKENLGFANGNNYGIRYAKENYKFNFLCCCNNDIILEQKDFFKKLSKSYNDNKIAVIAPKVFKKDNTIQTYDYNLKEIIYYKKLLKKYMFYKKHINILNIKRYMVKLFFKTRDKNYKNENYFMKDHYNILLHGCCLIFTPTFFENYDGFNKKTFLYKEEELLYNMIRKKNLKTFYNTKIYVTHLEDVATNSIVTTSKEKMKFIYTNQAKSLKVLIEELENE